MGNKLQGQAGTADVTNEIKDMVTVDKAVEPEIVAHEIING